MGSSAIERDKQFSAAAHRALRVVESTCHIAAGRHRSPDARRRNASRRLIHWQTLQQHAQGRGRPRDLRLVDAAAALFKNSHKTTRDAPRREGTEPAAARRGARLLGRGEARCEWRRRRRRVPVVSAGEVRGHGRSQRGERCSWWKCYSCL